MTAIDHNREVGTSNARRAVVRSRFESVVNGTFASGPSRHRRRIVHVLNLNSDANGFLVLDRLGCLERLAQHRVAALAITDRALPLVLPVLYTLHGEEIFVGAASSGILGRRMPNSVVSLCVHELQGDLLSGWTVTVTGRAELVSSPADLVDMAQLRQWGCADSTQVVVRVGTEHISGRQIPPPQLPRIW